MRTDFFYRLQYSLETQFISFLCQYLCSRIHEQLRVCPQRYLYIISEILPRIFPLAKSPHKGIFFFVLQYLLAVYFFICCQYLLSVTLRHHGDLSGHKPTMHGVHSGRGMSGMRVLWRVWRRVGMDALSLTHWPALWPALETTIK